MADDLSPLAAALRSEDRAYLGTYKSAAYWENLATAAREHLNVAPPAAPAERPTCATCPYWGDPNEKGEAICHRRAPNYTAEWRENWGATMAADWCGDHPAFPAWIAAREGG